LRSTEGGHETPQQIAARIRKVLAAVPADRMVPAPAAAVRRWRMVATMKLASLGEATRIVRAGVAGK